MPNVYCHGRPDDGDAHEPAEMDTEWNGEDHTEEHVCPECGTLVKS